MYINYLYNTNILHILTVLDTASYNSSDTENDKELTKSYVFLYFVVLPKKEMQTFDQLKRVNGKKNE